MPALPSVFKQLKRRDIVLVFAGALLTLAAVGVIKFIDSKRTPMPYQTTGITAAWIPDTVKYWHQPINEMAKKYNIDADLIAIVMTIESGGNAKAKSEANAVGLMQITAPTAKDIASKYLKKPVTDYNLENPDTNIEFGTAYLAHLRKVFGEPQQGPDWTRTVELMAAGYNGGPGAANNLLTGKGVDDTQTVVYSRDAFNMWRERVSKTSPTFDRWKERGGTTLLDAAKASQTNQ